MLSVKARPSEDVLDAVYLKYAESDPFLPVTHFIDHSTMGAEALVQLGLGDKVMEWVSHHPVRPYRAPRQGLAISAQWRQALGQRECHGDWIQHFETELGARPFGQVLAEWVPRFAHEVGAFLFHGLIRTAHATRALEQKDTLARRGELARGLALWAIGVRTPPPEALPEVQPGALGLFESTVDILGYARFGAVAFIDAPNVPKLHLVTGPMAYLLVADYLDPKTHQLAKASFAKTHSEAAQQFEALRQKVLDQPTAPIDHTYLEKLATEKDAHPSKLTEAALRAHETSKDELFLKAASKALDIHGLRALLAVVKGLIQR